MATIDVTTSLPKNLIEQFRQLGANIREDCDIVVVELLNYETTKAYDDFLASEKDVDLLLNPQFGPPLAPYVAPAVQAEVHQLLAAYQPLNARALAPGQPLPALGAYGATPPLG
ncbi:hypothetical protein HK097_004500, partial [Rhizophlyctis rosea]